MLLGYFLDYSSNDYLVSTSNVDKSRYKNVPRESLVKLGSELLLRAIEESFVLNRKHVVPISGGLDSRAILAGLLEFTDAENIFTFTFGTPNTLDYDIGNKVAKTAGTMHTSYPLTRYKYTEHELIDISKMMNHQTMLFHHGPINRILQRYSNHLYWSGFMGDTLSGDHMPRKREKDKKKAKKKFIESNRFVKSVNMLNVEEMELCGLLDYNENMSAYISYEEQLDLSNRQTKYIAPHVLMEGFSYRTPFLNKDWVEFILSIKDKDRSYQCLYKRILTSSFPKLFSIPTKGSFGRSLNDGRLIRSSYRLVQKIQRSISNYFPFVLDPHVNYISFNDGIRKREDLKKVIFDSIMDLKDRRIVDWVDIDKIWSDHLKKNFNHADALIVLASLEIHLKSGKILS